MVKPSLSNILSHRPALKPLYPIIMNEPSIILFFAGILFIIGIFIWKKALEHH